MDKADLKNIIESKKEPFLKKLKHAGLNELEYWEKRPENLSRELLIKYLNSIDETKEIYPDMSVRESDGGKYGQTGFKWVFKLKDNFQIIGRNIDIYIKGFFFEEHDPRGVEIQSFKRSVVLKEVK
ncbi:MAG: hypothetical protein A2381_15070 [Bdellovibrionales bacterium RIFOXYB1_FULL_37_110]|nr:MAG: hypothetical protein A2417_10575 [Bdellovibrionales bacterium RIFOXYC1_FULL_37_79]OFZ60186.1 MAG: hypothetical protein A2381_15070 [Bdellovibrionales bacterium RIFOXYB1_FULL_37_110]OFZ64320.1 MAG: hypothetical protein A2577_09700 [Bdellovibrionales bacterium RIFOXYD1_FULL_36_51]